jgi:hypothetical protein
MIRTAIVFVVTHNLIIIELNDACPELSGADGMDSQVKDQNLTGFQERWVVFSIKEKRVDTGFKTGQEGGGVLLGEKHRFLQVA